MGSKSSHSRAVTMAADDVKMMLSRLHGQTFMDDGLSARTKAIKERIANSPEAKSLLDRGFTQSYADRVARSVKPG